MNTLRYSISYRNKVLKTLPILIIITNHFNTSRHYPVHKGLKTLSMQFSVFTLNEDSALQFAV